MAKRKSSAQVSPANKSNKTVDAPKQSKIAVLGALYVRLTKVVAHPPANFWELHDPNSTTPTSFGLVTSFSSSLS
ncbi:uncharacterized protein N7529_000526 [Penicillium soppii]|uniref:uncharacterized protein n=1 Tax=Penicillium soppii TaxID=69789 RepID=UPI0025475C8F|nr:uncharacterized protein N7529_000526 [Penicillium soppii]KAJ5881854.1 hypothetical protein N7529_000526 [Penicillium soppii]